MNTAQVLLMGHSHSVDRQQTVSTVPWIVGALVVIFALWFISKKH